MHFRESGFFTGWTVENFFRAVADDIHEVMDVIAPTEAKYAHGRYWMGPSGTLYGHTLTDHATMAGLVRAHLGSVDLQTEACFVRLHIEADQVNVEASLPITELQFATVLRIASIHRATPFYVDLRDECGRRISTTGTLTGIEAFQSEVHWVRWPARPPGRAEYDCRRCRSYIALR
jgi:hypothetical protein